MTTNPYAYYDDEPLPLKTRPLSVSTGGEEEPDMEPRIPLELQGHFIAFFRPAVKTYRVTVERDTFECRLPGGEFFQLTRVEAAKRISVHGHEIDITVPGRRTYTFRCKAQKNLTLTLARLKVWLRLSPADPEEAYNAVAEELKKNIGRSFFVLAGLFLAWLAFMAYWYYPYWTFHRPGVLLFPAVLYFGVCLLRLVCLILFSAFLVLWLSGRVNAGLLYTSSLLALIFPVYRWITILYPELQIDILRHSFVSLEFYSAICVSLVMNGIYHDYRLSEKQLQRDNGLI